jgi:carbonic anhydrase
MRSIHPQIARTALRPEKIATMKIPLAGAILLLALGLPQMGRSQSPTAPQSPEASQLELKLREAIEKGATMEEIAKLKAPTIRTPEEAIRALKVGNARFFGGHARRPELSANERRAQIITQTPFAVILGCSDSRVPIEIVYDQGLGEIFAIRVAGEIVEPATAGSIEYAIVHLKTKLLVVMGHEGCGAVKAAMLPEKERSGEPENVRYLLDQIVPSVSDLPKIRDEKARTREAVIANVRMQVKRATENPVVKAAVEKKELAVIGAYYEISSGQVDFLETDDELRIK